MTRFAQAVQAWKDGLAFSTGGFVGWLVRRTDWNNDLVGVVVGIKDGVSEDCCDWCKEVCTCRPDPETNEWPECCKEPVE